MEDNEKENFVVAVQLEEEKVLRKKRLPRIYASQRKECILDRLNIEPN